MKRSLVWFSMLGACHHAPPAAPPKTSTAFADQVAVLPSVVVGLQHLPRAWLSEQIMLQSELGVTFGGACFAKLVPRIDSVYLASFSIDMDSSSLLLHGDVTAEEIAACFDADTKRLPSRDRRVIAYEAMAVPSALATIAPGWVLSTRSPDAVLAVLAASHAGRNPLSALTPPAGEEWQLRVEQ